MNVLFLKGGAFGIPENSFKQSLDKINDAIKINNINAVIWDGDPLPVVEYKKDLGFANLLPFIKEANPNVSMITFKGAINAAAAQEKINELSNPNNIYRDKAEEPFKHGYNFFTNNTDIINITGDQTVADVPNLNPNALPEIAQAIEAGKNAIVITPKFTWKELGLNIMKIMKNLGVNCASLAVVAGGYVVKQEQKARDAAPSMYPTIINISLDKVDRKYMDDMRWESPECDMYCTKGEASSLAEANRESDAERTSTAAGVTRKGITMFGGRRKSKKRKSRKSKKRKSRKSKKRKSRKKKLTKKRKH
jgi:hypothetical protein